MLFTILLCRQLEWGIAERERVKIGKSTWERERKGEKNRCARKMLVEQATRMIRRSPRSFARDITARIPGRLSAKIRVQIRDPVDGIFRRAIRRTRAAYWKRDLSLKDARIEMRIHKRYIRYSRVCVTSVFKDMWTRMCVKHLWVAAGGCISSLTRDCIRAYVFVDSTSSGI